MQGNMEDVVKAKNIMVINLGSTSYKFKCYRMSEIGSEELLATGEFENIGSVASSYRISIGNHAVEENAVFPTHADAFAYAVDYMIKEGILSSMNELDAVGYKSVHAGTVSGTKVINDEILSVMEFFNVLAPAHNPIYIRLMKQLKEAYPGLIQIGHFETSFHTTIPEKRVVYGVPHAWKEEMGIRRYGFHGSSHEYIAWKMHEAAPDVKKIISLHLGGSSSVCAIEDGKSIASSMGATPQTGLFHNNRIGDFDVFCLPILMERYGGSLDRVLKVLSSESGLLGLSGVSSDLREVIKAAKEGNIDAELAIEAFVDNIVGYIGMFSAYLKGLDAIVFTGGIGLKSNIIRKRVCAELTYSGLCIDDDANEAGVQGKISTKESRIAVYVWETNEELVVLRKCFHMLA